MAKKGDSDILAVGVVVAIMLIIIAVVLNISNFGKSVERSGNNQYYLTDVDVTLTGIIKSFEKTALFFGMMNATKELGEHGGVSMDVISQASALKPVMQVDNGIAYLAPVECDSGCSIKKRMPFVSYMSYDEKIGTAATKFLLVDANRYSQNMADVKSGKYGFSALVQIFMLKKGAVTIKVCQGAICPITETVSETDTKTIRIESSMLANANEDINLAVSASEDNVAVLRQIAASIYDGDVVESPNLLLEANVNTYQDKLQSFSHEGINYKINELRAVFLPSRTGVYNMLDEKEGFVRGIAWAPDRIIAESPEVQVSSEGIAEEDAKIRYWLMYWYAAYFVDTFESLTKPRLLNKIDEELNRDYSYSAMANCGGGFKCTDATLLYTRDDAFIALNNGLNSLAAEFNTAYKNKGIIWKFSIPGELFTTGNFESIYKADPHHSEGVCSYACGEECTTDEKGAESCTTTYCEDIYYTCSDKYTRHHTLNHIKILAEITDEKYKTFDADTKTWASPKFQFFVELDGLDDNYCDGYYCDSIIEGATLPQITITPSVPQYP